MTDNDMKEYAEAVAWWLDEKNAEARRQLKEHNEELAMWLDLVERKVQEAMAKKQVTMKV